MAAVTRQPFAPLNEARLHSLTSLKNRQNAISSPSPVKRKASDVNESDNSENVDPVLFSKRAKGTDGFLSKDTFIKPSTFFLTKSASANDLSVSSSYKPATPLPRASSINPSPAGRLPTGIGRSSPLSASGGRPLRRKRSGGLLSSRRRTAGSFTRVDPPVFGASSSSAPFSLEAALRGTIPSYTSHNEVSSKKASSGLSDFSGLHEPELKSSWFFDIHEDTMIDEAANAMDHQASGLTIESDEEKRKKEEEEYAECKENHPPLDDISQTSHPRAMRASANLDDMVIEKERKPLGEMDPKEFYSEGCDENSIIIIHDDEEETPVQDNSQFVPGASLSTPIDSETQDGCEVPTEETYASAEELMQKTNDPAPSAAVLEPLEGTGESFEVWESSSAKDETEAVAEC